MGYYSNHSTSKATREKQKVERLGEERCNNQGCLMKVIEYEKTSSIVVEFQDEYKAKVNTRYSEFAKGKVRNPYYPNAYGGMIGNKYPAKINDKVTKEYYVWKNMLKDCMDNILFTCCKEWLMFENFYEWLHEQENFDKFLSGDRWVLSKNIINNNNLFSPETCFLVPNNVYRLFIEQDLNVDDVSESVVLEYKEHKKKIIRRTAKKEFLNENITERCYQAMMDYKL